MKTEKPQLYQYTISQIEKVSRNKQIICFGSGNNLTYIFSAMQDLQMENRVHYIVDNDSGKWGQNRVLNGRNIRIEPPEKLKTEHWDSHILLIAIVDYRAVLKQVKGLLKGTDAICLVSPKYRYWYDRIIDQMMLKQPLQNAIVLQGEGDTCENAKALMQVYKKQKKDTNYKIAWLSDNTDRNCRKCKYETYLLRDLPLKKHTIKSIYTYYQYINRARFLIYENKMMPKARSGQISCYMNHGIPLKATKGKIQVYQDTDYVLSPSENMNDIIREQFGAQKEQLVICGAPRTDCLFRKETKRQLSEFLHLNRYRSMILWAPTFRVHENYSRRDSEKAFRFGLPLLEREEDYRAVLNALKKQNILLVIKPHIHQELSELTVNETDYIRIIKQDLLDRLGCNVYDLMKLSDAMITDYSSIGFDYLLLDRPLGYTIDDMEQYTIGFSVPNPLAYMPGIKMKNTGDLLTFLDMTAFHQDEYAEERNRLRNRLYAHQDGKNSKRLLTLLGLRGKARN